MRTYLAEKCLLVAFWLVARDPTPQAESLRFAISCYFSRWSWRVRPPVVRSITTVDQY